MSQHDHKSQLECLKKCLPDFLPEFIPNLTSTRFCPTWPKLPTWPRNFFPQKKRFFCKIKILCKLFYIKPLVIISFLISPARYFRYSLWSDWSIHIAFSDCALLKKCTKNSALNQCTFIIFFSRSWILIFWWQPELGERKIKYRGARVRRGRKSQNWRIEDSGRFSEIKPSDWSKTEWGFE